ncbi:MAG: UxaA family hydrolase [Caldilineaceae bacterium]
MLTCFQIHPTDNTAVLLEDGTDGSLVQVIGAGADTAITLTQAIAYGHKVALTDIAQGAAVMKYGIRIGHATQPIRAGAWVHLHNCASDYDERSGSLEVESGKPTDTVYA